MSKIKCATCEYGDWSYSGKKCKDCVGFSKWVRMKVKRPAPKPVYLGHRDE